MAGITIVALPADDESVWKLSSQKKPHLTLLHMNGPLENEENTIQFIQHAAETTLSRFGLSVDRRGTLGPDNADVLFFSNEFGIDKLRDFRAQLLTNADIAKQHVKTDQFPGWIPHLTMGYPGSPGKIPEERWELNWINFDRIAVWTGNFDGPEFNLNANDMLAVPDSAAWSEPHGVYICQSGVKGMRWGVRRKTGPDGLVVGSVSDAAKKSSPDTDEALKILKGKKGSKASSDHKQMVKNLDKKVEQLSTKEIQEITKRIEAVGKLKTTTDAQNAAKQGKIRKITAWALNSAVNGVKREGDKYIQELSGKQLRGILPDVDDLIKKKPKADSSKTDEPKTEAPKAEDHPNFTTKSGPTTSDFGTPTKSEPTPERKKALEDLVYEITTLPKKKED